MADARLILWWPSDTPALVERRTSSAAPIFVDVRLLALLAVMREGAARG